MINPSFTTTPTMPTIECDAAMSDAVLQAARAAMPADPAKHFLLPHAIRQLPAKQQPLVPLLMALLDAAEAVAKAVDDNAWDDSQPLERSMAEEIANQAYRIGACMSNSTQCAGAGAWSLPSMTHKELV